MLKHLLMVGAVAVSLVGALAPQQAMADGKAVRPEVGKPVQAALDLLKTRKTKEAMAKLREADAVAGKSPYEAYLVDRVKAQALATAGDASAAAQAFEAAATSSAAPAAERIALLGAAAGQYYSARAYGKAAALAQRYAKEGGSDPAIRALYVQSLYLANDFAAVQREVGAEIRNAEKAGRKPGEDQLQMLAQAQLKLDDKAGYAKTMETLVRHYPSKETWQSVIYTARQSGGMGDRLALDLARLQMATGTLKSTSDFESAAQLALQEGYPIEAKKYIDQGFAASQLGQGNDAQRHGRLRDMAERNLAEDKKTLAAEEAKAQAAPDGTAALKTGFNLVLHGQQDKGIALMEAGLKKGGMKRPDDAKLRLGYAYFLAGNKGKAAQTFKSVGGTDGAASLAGLWLLYLGQR